jgi:hypothetical protein
MKQPRYFYKKAPLKGELPDTNSLIEASTDSSSEVVHLPAILSRFSLPPKLLFTIGFASLACIVSIGFLPQVLRTRQPITLLPTTAFQQPTVLENKGNSNGLHFEARTTDGRVDIVAAFLARYKSPLTPYDKYAKVLVSVADTYGLDYRLLPAIMMQESNLCKASDPTIHNCLGFGIHKRGTLSFDTYEEGFDRAARELKERYLDIGLTTPEQIMTKYTPSSPNGAWAKSVTQWITEMEYNSRDKGITVDEDTDLKLYSKMGR